MLLAQIAWDCLSLTKALVFPPISGEMSEKLHKPRFIRKRSNRKIGNAVTHSGVAVGLREVRTEGAWEGVLGFP